MIRELNGKKYNVERVNYDDLPDEIDLSGEDDADDYGDELGDAGSLEEPTYSNAMQSRGSQPDSTMMLSLNQLIERNGGS